MLYTYTSRWKNWNLCAAVFLLQVYSRDDLQYSWTPKVRLRCSCYCTWMAKLAVPCDSSYSGFHKVAGRLSSITLISGVRALNNLLFDNCVQILASLPWGISSHPYDQMELATFLSLYAVGGSVERCVICSVSLEMNGKGRSLCERVGEALGWTYHEPNSSVLCENTWLKQEDLSLTSGYWLFLENVSLHIYPLENS